MMKKNQSDGLTEGDCSRQIGRFKTMNSFVFTRWMTKEWCRMQNVIFLLECIFVRDQEDTEGIYQRGNGSRWLRFYIEYGVSLVANADFEE